MAADVVESSLEPYEVWVYDPALGKDGWSKRGPYHGNEAAVSFAREERRNGRVAIVEKWGALESRSFRRAAEVVKTAHEEIERDAANALFAAKNAPEKSEKKSATTGASGRQEADKEVRNKPGVRPSLLTRNDRFARVENPRKDSQAAGAERPKLANAPRVSPSIRRFAPLARPSAPQPAQTPQTDPTAPDADDLPI